MRKRSWLLLVVVAVAAVAAFEFWPAPKAPPGGAPPGTASAPAPAPAPAARPVPVETAVAGRRDVPIFLQGLGNVQAFNSVTIRPQVDGQLVQVAFTEGQTVHAGEVLARIDPRSYQAALDQVVAKKAQDEAQLANARLDLERYAGLIVHQYSSRQLYDTTKALVAQLEATVKGDQAAIDNAQVQLGYTSVTSPLNGLAGIRLVDQGNIVHASDPGGLVVITQIRPISVVFSLPEDTVPRLVKAMASTPPAVTALSRDGKQTLDQGRLVLVDNQIDQTTGTVRLKATLPNQDGLLWPGQFVNVRVLTEVRHQALTAPATAVLRGQQGTYAYVVRADQSVEVRPVTAGPFVEGFAVIDAGLAEGETVVTAGQYRLQAGAKVQVRPPGTAAALRAGQPG